MNSHAPEIIKNISRKRYVKEKLFNQMLNEICARQSEMQDTIELDSEYTEKFGRKEFRDSHQQKMPNDNFKLYGKHSDAISFWNTTITNGRGHFKQYHPLTKLNIECLDEQWR